MRVFNVVFMIGFVATQVLSWYDGVLWVWPIWWSQTGLAENGALAHQCFSATTLMVALHFLWHNGLIMSWRQFAMATSLSWFEQVRWFCGVAGILAFAGLGHINSNLGNERRIHNGFGALSGLGLATYLCMSVARGDPATRNPIVRTLTWVGVACAFVALFVIENVIKKRIVGWDPALWNTYDSTARNWIRVSALAQWSQLALFVLLTELVDTSF
jgi:hypothetical protein